MGWRSVVGAWKVLNLPSALYEKEALPLCNGGGAVWLYRALCGREQG